MSKTAAERAAEINREASEEEGQKMTIVHEDAQHWANRGVFTGDELDQYRACEEYKNAHEEFHGWTPPAQWWGALTTQQWKAKINAMFN